MTAFVDKIYNIRDTTTLDWCIVLTSKRDAML